MPLSLPQVEQIRWSAAMSTSVPSNVVEGLVFAVEREEATERHADRVVAAAAHRLGGKWRDLD